MNIEKRREKVRLRNIKWRTENPSGYLQAAAKYRSSHRNKIRAYRWKIRYNITPKRYDEMVKSQNNRCAICGKEETAKHNYTKNVQRLAVDHSHATGKVRGLLCQDCNRGLGKFHDDIARLEKAIQYLRQYQ